MHKIFLPIYRFFKSRKALMYSILAVLTLFFAFFASKIDLEENLLKLFPMENEESRLAFEDLRVKDKLFIQILPNGERIDTFTLFNRYGALPLWVWFAILILLIIITFILYRLSRRRDRRITERKTPSKETDAHDEHED